MKINSTLIYKTPALLQKEGDFKRLLTRNCRIDSNQIEVQSLKGPSRTIKLSDCQIFVEYFQKNQIFFIGKQSLKEIRRFEWVDPSHFKSRLGIIEKGGKLSLVYFKSSKLADQIYKQHVIMKNGLAQKYKSLIEERIKNYNINFSVNFLRTLKNVCAIKKDVIFKKKEQIKPEASNDIFAAFGNLLDNPQTVVHHQQEIPKDIMNVFGNQLNRSQFSKENISPKTITDSPSKLLFNLKKKLSHSSHIEDFPAQQSFYKFKLHGLQNEQSNEEFELLQTSQVKEKQVFQQIKESLQEDAVTNRKFFQQFIQKKAQPVPVKSHQQALSVSWTQQGVQQRRMSAVLVQCIVMPAFYKTVFIKESKQSKKQSKCSYILSKLKGTCLYQPLNVFKWSYSQSLRLQVSFDNSLFHSLTLIRSQQQGFVLGLVHLKQEERGVHILFTFIVQSQDIINAVSERLLPLFRNSLSWRIYNFSLQSENILKEYHSHRKSYLQRLHKALWNVLAVKAIPSRSTAEYLLLNLGLPRSKRYELWQSMCGSLSEEQFSSQKAMIQRLCKSDILDIYQSVKLILYKREYLSRFSQMLLRLTFVIFKTGPQALQQFQFLFAVAKSMTQKMEGTSLQMINVLIRLMSMRAELVRSQQKRTLVQAFESCSMSRSKKRQLTELGQFWFMNFMGQQVLQVLIDLLLFYYVKSDYVMIDKVLRSSMRPMLQTLANPHSKDKTTQEQVRRYYQVEQDGWNFLSSIANFLGSQNIDDFTVQLFT